MRKYSLAYLFGRSLVLAVLAPSVFFSIACAADVKILLVEGDVKVRTNPSEPWIPALANALLFAHMEVLTGPNSRCELGFTADQKSVVKMDPDTHLVLANLNPVSLKMQQGKVLSLVENLSKGSSFEVISPTAVASVRGTSWEQSLDTVRVFDHTVRVRAGGKEKDIHAGSAVRIEKNGSLGESFRISDAEMDDWKRYRDMARDRFRLSAQIQPELKDITQVVAEPAPVPAEPGAEKLENESPVADKDAETETVETVIKFGEGEPLEVKSLESGETVTLDGKDKNFLSMKSDGTAQAGLEPLITAKGLLGYIVRVGVMEGSVQVNTDGNKVHYLSSKYGNNVLVLRPGGVAKVDRIPGLNLYRSRLSAVTGGSGRGTALSRVLTAIPKPMANIVDTADLSSTDIKRKSDDLKNNG